MNKIKILQGLKIASFFLVMLGCLYCFNEYQAVASTLPGFDSTVKDSQLQKIDGTGDGIVRLKDWVEKRIVPNIKNLFVAISILLLLYYVFQFIIATSAEDTDKQKTNLLWAAVGFALIGISMKIVEVIAPGESKNLETIGDVKVADSTIAMVIIFIQYLAGGVAFLFMIVAAVRIIIAQGVEEEINKQKKNFTWGAFGLMVVMLSRPLVNALYGRQQAGGMTSVQPGNIGEDGAEQIVGIIQYVLQYLGITSVLALIVAGVFYVTSFGDDEKVAKAKRIIFATLIGIVIIYSSYAIVAYVARPVADTLK